MAVKIVTDSLSDITQDIAQGLGITIVPLTVTFGRESFIDRVTITTDEFYHKLVNDPNWPTTTQPPPGDFINAYEKLAQETNEILVVTLSNRLSGTYQSALQAKNMVSAKCRIEVIDSENVAMGLGLIVLSLAEAAQAGAGLDKLVGWTNKAINRSHLVAYFDTLKYLAKGGRIGKAQGMMGSLLSVKPLLTVKDGEMSPLTRVRSKAAGMDYLYNFAAGFSRLDKAAVEYSTTPDDADELIKRLGQLLPKEHIYKSTISPVVGTYSGPGAMALTVLEAE